MKSFHIITFGCQMNEHDSERMAGLLEAQGYVRASSPDTAGMVILNTCSIRQKAEQKFYSELGRLTVLRKENPGLSIAVAGCIAQQEGKKILSRAPQVGLVMGPSDLANLPSFLEQSQGRNLPLVEISGDPAYHEKSLPASRTDRLKAWVSIMYGCDNFCSYCVVPHVRGRERSRSAEDIVREVQGLAGQGYKEITLLGQNVNSYGRGLDRQTDFPSLLRRVSEVDGIERIRFVTSHPKDLSPGLITALRDLPKVCEALHLPAQSGSDRILKGMNRKYTRAEYLERVAALREAVPGLALTTDIIVGFPGETEDEYAATLELLRQVQYDGIFAFKYSKRPGTAALTLDGHLKESVKESRLAEVLDLQKDISLRRHKALIGAMQEILVEGPSKRGSMLTGRTRSNKVVNFPGAASLISSLVSVRITRAALYSLGGELCA